MKNNKRVFILIEAVLAVMVIVTALLMFRENTEKNDDKVSVIIQNSEDNKWSAFIYGLKMAAQDCGSELFIVNTEQILTVEEEQRLIEREIDNGADAIILQPVPGADTEAMLKKFKKIPMMFVEDTVSEDGEASFIPMTKPDNDAMGVALAEELLKDYNGSLDGKILGIVSQTEYSQASIERERGFKETIKDKGAMIRWTLYSTDEVPVEILLESQPKVDIVIALDDDSLTVAGKCAADKNLHGAIIYGIGNSTEAVYYLDTGFCQCLVVPDEFSVGYQSLTELTKSMGRFSRKAQSRTVSYAVIRRETLFSKENQDILFTMIP